MRTLFDKVWDDHVIRDFGGGDYLLHVDRHWLNDAGYNAISALDERGLPVRNPELTFAVIDHLVEIYPGRTYESRIPNSETWARGTVAGCRKHGIRLIDLDDPRHGITHVISPELGVTLPGSLVVCTDSHTATNGAFGAYACGFGSSGGTHTLATQTLVQRRPKTMRVVFDGRMSPGVGPKDVVLHLIGTHSAAGGLGYAIEFAGPVVERMSMQGRMTICNMGVEFGGTTAMVAPDDETFEFLAGREFAPAGAAWDRGVAYWRTLHSDDTSSFDRELMLDCTGLAPQVTWGTNPEHVTAVDGVVPAAGGGDAASHKAHERALEYMGLEPGQVLEGLPIGAAYIGSCTNARLEDLRAAADLLRGRRAAEGVRAICVPGSAAVKHAAEAEGIDAIFKDAGFEWSESGCAMCTSSAADRLPPGTRAISSTNRNFENRQGPGVRTHLASPATVAASAVAGRIADVRKVTS